MRSRSQSRGWQRSARLTLGVIQQVLTAISDWEIPSGVETAVQVARDLGLLAIAIGGFRILARRFPALREVGLPAHPWGRARLAAGFFGAVSLTIVAVMAIDPDLSMPLVLAIVVVRWPVSVVAEQVLFFGWLQPRLADHRLRTIVLLFAAYHLYSPVLAVLVAPLGLAFAHLRRRTGTIYSGIALHWIVEVGFLSLS